MKYFRYAAIVMGGVVLVFMLVSLPYFAAHIRFWLQKPPIIPEQELHDIPKTAQAHWLSIPSLGIQAPIVYVEDISESIFQTALRSGVVHFPQTAKPGELGNVYLFGHSSDYPWAQGDFKTILALLPQIKNGAQIVVTNGTGDEFVYTVIDQFVVSPNDTKVLDQGSYERRLLTLQTSYPIGTALRRYIVVTELVSDK